MNHLTAGLFNHAIENAVTAYLGSTFQITNIIENKNGAMHAAAVFEGVLASKSIPYRVFVKAGTNPFSPDQFEKEAQELTYIRTHTPVKAPEVIAVVQEADTVLLILEAINVVTPETKNDWALLGQGLATLHGVQSDKCGFEFSTYLGVFKQDNTQKSTWREFYGECRLRDTMKMAVAAGKMNTEQCEHIEKLIARLPEICPEPKTFSLLHGDSWIGNLLYDRHELVAIDCSLYYGNREIDLTNVDFFCPVPDYFFDAYEEAFPTEPGYAERRDLWKINQWLGHVTLFGEKYMGRLMDAVNRYL